MSQLYSAPTASFCIEERRLQLDLGYLGSYKVVLKWRSVKWSITFFIEQGNLQKGTHNVNLFPKCMLSNIRNTPYCEH
jgi:hypothetical protein